MKLLTVLIVIIMMLAPMSAQASPDSLVFYGQSITNQVMWEDTNFNVTEKGNSGCRVEVSGKKGDTFTTRCSTSSDAYVEQCTLESNDVDKFKVEVINPSFTNFEVRWTMLKDVNDFALITCIVLGIRSANPDAEVERIEWKVQSTNLSSFDVPIVEDEDFFSEIFLPLVTRAWSG